MSRVNRMMYLGWNTDKDHLMDEYNRVKNTDAEMARFLRDKIHEIYGTWMHK